MEKIISKLNYPFQYGLNPLWSSANAHTLDWIKKLGLEKTANNFSVHKFNDLNVGKAIGRTFPNAGLEELCVICDYTLFHFMVDDIGENLPAGKKGDFFQQIRSSLMKVMYEDRIDPKEENIIIKAYYDIWRRFVSLSNPVWLKLYIEAHEAFYEAWEREANNEDNGYIPSLEEYLEFSQIACGGYTYCYFADLTEKTFIPYEIQKHQDIQKIVNLAALIFRIFNDIISLRKELYKRSTHNIVTVIKTATGLSWEDSISKAIEIHNGRMELLLRLCKEVPHFTDKIDVLVQRYLSGICAVAYGHYKWSITDTGRYEESKHH